MNNKKKNKKNGGHCPNSKSKLVNLTWLVILGYMLYLFLVLMMRLPNVAENFTEYSMPDTIEYHLSFPKDGRQSHYYVERVNQSISGRIDVNYYRISNTLQTNSVNIKSLTIFCRSMYYDECKDVFGFEPEQNSNYYKWFFIEKNHLNVNIDSDSSIETLKFVDVPKPSAVIVDNVLWTESKEYEYHSSEGIALSNVSAGSTNVDIYFKSIPDGSPVAKIIPSRTWIQVNENLALDGAESYDPSPGGRITNYIWDFGEGNFSTGQSIVNHKYPEPGVYGIILTVVDDEFNIGHDYLNITVISATDLCIYGIVPHITLLEDSHTWTLELRNYEPVSNDPGSNYFWFITGEDNTLYSLSGENSTNDKLLITPLSNKFGNDMVLLWLEKSENARVYQPLWINITPVNDPPTIFGIPDITIHYDVPYQFNYLLYIQDVDTPFDELVLNSSDPIHTIVSGFNVTYIYPKSMLDETEYVILTIWDGLSESSDAVAIWITDDWVPNLVIPLPDVHLDEGEIHKNYFDLDEYFMDPDNDSLYYSYGYTHVNVIINPDHTVDFFAPDNWNGEEMTTFRATDPSGALVEDIITVVVRPINDPPIIKNIPNLVVRYDQDYIFDLSPYISDEDTPVNELILSTSDLEHIRIDNTLDLTIILNYPYRPNIPYTQTVTLSVTDGMNTSYQIITVYVKDNYPPVLVKPFQEIILNEDVPKFNALNFHDYFLDNDSSMLYFKVINNNKVTTQINVNGSLDLGSEPNWSGSEVITFRAIDPELAIAEGVLDVKVLAVNDPPILLEIPIQRFNVTEKFRLDLYPYLFDVDNNVTQLEIRLEDCEIDFEIHGSDVIFYATKPLTSTVTLYVSDGNAESSQKILLEVTGRSKTEQSLLFEFSILIVIVIIMVLGIVGFAYRNYRGNYDIVELFLIYCNGCMIFHLANEDVQREETDADIISAMFTAVQDFTRDSFAHGNMEDENWSLKRLEFKNNNILVERGKYLYIAVVFTGAPGKKLGRKLNRIRSKIETMYTADLKNWDGDLDRFKGAEDIISQYNLIARPKLTKQKYSSELPQQRQPNCKSH